MSSHSQVELINQEINKELANDQVAKALLATTFKGLTPIVMKQAIMDGMIRGFTFLNFRQKDVYAIPFGKESYSLITSIDYSRKIGARSGIVGKKAPIYEMNGKTIESCTVTVLKKTGDYIGEFTATVYFDEYNKKANLWLSKPRTMIAKVAEMHALRMACPEELSKTYISEEIETPATAPTIKDRLKVVQEETGEDLTMGAIAKKPEAKKENKPAEGSFAAEVDGLMEGEVVEE